MADYKELFSRNISELKASVIEIGIVPMNGAITKVRKPVNIKIIIKMFLFMIKYCYARMFLSGIL